VRTRAGSLEWLFGSPFVEASVLGVGLRVHAASFFQANRFLYEELARTVVDLVRRAARGSSTCTRASAFRAAARRAQRARDGRGEQSAVACEDARFAARRAGLGH
jgi:hypothetical protein